MKYGLAINFELRFSSLRWCVLILDRILDSGILLGACLSQHCFRRVLDEVFLQPRRLFPYIHSVWVAQLSQRVYSSGYAFCHRFSGAISRLHWDYHLVNVGRSKFVRQHLVLHRCAVVGCISHYQHQHRWCRGCDANKPCWKLLHSRWSVWLSGDWS
jgi:hypothetical protein